jgi:hypothetical protein
MLDPLIGNDEVWGRREKEMKRAEKGTTKRKE